MSRELRKQAALTPRISGDDVTAKSARLDLLSSHVSDPPPGTPISRQSEANSREILFRQIEVVLVKSIGNAWSQAAVVLPGKDQAPGREMCPWVAMDSTSTMMRVQLCSVSVFERHLPRGPQRNHQRWR